MMKKKFLFLLIPLLACGLSSCVMYNGQPKSGSKNTTPSSSSPSGDTSVTPPDPSPHDTEDDSKEGDQITVYLVFGQYGKYEGELVSTSDESLFLEHVKKMENMVVGSDLPGKDKVTSSVSGSEFKTWVMYKNDGKLTEYTKVPAIDNAILYATFSGGNGGGSSGGGGSQGGGGSTSEFTPSSADDLRTEGYGFRFLGTHVTYMAAVHTEDFDGFQQYKISSRAFKKNQEFQLYDFANKAGWTVPLDKYSFGGSESHPTEWEKYVSRNGDTYTVLQDFNVSDVYIKLKFGEDQLYFALG